ncbi:leucine--tRNA ligase [Thermomicrobium sp. CFH 73360]|uniref:leucine--tRNA ligase n=1 Tax=Thermomicrobium sp. CFH 73360 TaxID=2951987 RepID=UPI0020767BBA|nr:leucine--tRNA ligase [Thermomicrobium sp. CFH 73360]MCM8745119.1 leucine--tRNA ligase [Thermomicrobium sp. CFH 73360]
MATTQQERQTERYEPLVIEPKWQKIWEETGIYADVREDPTRPKWYHLVMFPYPSGNLHIGHWFSYAPADAAARYKRMRGYNVLFPFGFDAFGLPAENAAIKHGIHPKVWTMQNIAHMKKQLRSMGAMFDWSKEVITCLPEYYRWNQWFFLQFYKHGLAYRAKAPVWWCPTCQTVLANEQVIDGRCERCGTEVYRRDLEQWFLRITAYAEELLRFDGIEWPERVITMQRNWIGRSEGVRIVFRSERGDPIEVFTTRPDTLWGATFLVLAPEHPLVETLTTPERRADVEAYVEQARRRSDIERTSTEREKTGVFIGAYAINPANGERIPIWIADYVLMHYGTGAIMAVPAHDQRDFEFARAFGLPIVVVIQPPDRTLDPATMEEAYDGEGVMVNSGPFDGTPTAGGEAVRKVIAWLEEQGIGRGEVTYRLRDWLISRQRYWGTPIPIVYCDRCGIVPVPEEQLPVLLPEDAEFMPTGQSPLVTHEAFVNTECPQCGGPARRETDTMDTFVDSSWYWYRYLSPHEDQRPFDPDKVAYWTPVDQYTGGIEHAILHLLYSRFWTKALADLGLVNHREPFLRLFNHGVILGEDGEKMSKSRGNVVDPDDLVARLGADTVRLYLMFIGPWSQGGPWSSRGVAGVQRFLQRVWSLVNETRDVPVQLEDDDQARALRRLLHRTIKQVTDDFETFSFNTAIARMMEFVNELSRLRETPVVQMPVWREALETLVLLLAPGAPHIAEELWERLGKPYSVHQQAWPAYDPELAAEETLELVIQVNGRVRDRIVVPVTISEEEAVARARAAERVQAYLAGRRIERVVYVPGRLVNFVVSEAAD